MKLLIDNVNLILEEKLLHNAWLAIENCEITDFGTGIAPKEQFESRLNGGGNYLSPGFVDTHVHGGGGGSFSDVDETSFLLALRTHLKGGTTTITPTFSSMEHDLLLRNLVVFNRLKERESSFAFIPHLAGVHLEGPYFSQEQRGAQNSVVIRNPDSKEYLELLSATNHIRRWSIACELPGALEMGDQLYSKGICASIGHSNATTEQVFEAYLHGYRCVTHFYSGCSSLHRNGPYREGGVVEGAYLIDSMDVEMIADGVHLPPPFLKLIYKIKGADRIALVTDCIRAGGMPYNEGDFVYGDKEQKSGMYLENGVAIMPDRKNFAGSIATTIQLVRTLVQKADISLIEAVKMASLTPARMLGLDDHIGSIEKGKQADLLLIDKNLHVRECILAGAPLELELK